MKSAALLLGLLAIGCSSVALPEHSYYLMRLLPAARVDVVESPAQIGIRRVRVAPYLEDRGLALAARPNEVHNARFHQWAEPLADGLRSLLRSELSSTLGREVDDDPSMAHRWRYAVDVGVDSFHGTAEGNALLVADWRITRIADGDEVARHRFSQQQALAEPGYPALVRAEIELARRFSGAVADSLRNLQ